MSRQAVVASLRCAEHASRRFVVMNAGRVCCASDSLSKMCDECRPVAAAPAAPPAQPPAAAAAVRPTGAATVALPPQTQYADPPPSLRAQLERRGGRLVTAATSVAAAGYADPPPSLAERLAARGR
jgi:hypothetical protein